LSIRALNAVASFEEKKPERKLLIWLSPGWDLIRPWTQLSSKDRQSIFGTIVAASAALWQARITLYSIDPGGAGEAGSLRTTYFQEFLKPLRTAGQAQDGNLLLPVLAEQSGGRVLSASNDIAGEIASCAAEADSYYVLSFDSPLADGPNDFHALEVKIGKPGLTARTRAGHYDQP
jgi:VWFA-related protein